MQGEVVDPAPAEHRRLAAGLCVPGHLEEVELCVFPDLHEGECPLLPEMLYSQDLCLEHVSIELHEALGVVREHRHVVEAVGEHATPPCPGRPGSHAVATLAIAPHRVQAVAELTTSRSWCRAGQFP